MPIPKPRTGESKGKFVSRCISFLVGEGRAQDQASAICYGVWRDKGEDKMETDKIEKIITEREPIRAQADALADDGKGYAAPAQLLGGLTMYEEIDPSNPEQVGPKKDELDELLPVK